MTTKDAEKDSAASSASVSTSTKRLGFFNILLDPMHVTLPIIEKSSKKPTATGRCVITYEDGTVARFIDGVVSSHEDEAAIVSVNEEVNIWVLGGKIHREGENPAFMGEEVQCWFREGKLHRERGGPAILANDGFAKWFLNGVLHREGGLPAILYPDGSQEWWEHGQLHRDDNRPAIMRAERPARDMEYEEYWSRGMRHRVGGPAVVLPDGREEYWFEGKRHREGGPAIVYPEGYVEYWVNGEYFINT